MRFTKKKVCRYMKKILPEKKGIFADKPLVLRRKREERFEDLEALHKTAFIWCIKREQMIPVRSCANVCRRKDKCRYYQNYMNGCDKNGNCLL